MRKFIMGALCLVLLTPALAAQSGNRSGYLINPDTGEIEIRDGTVRFETLSSETGVVVFPGAALIVDGELNAGSRLVCTGGNVQTGGNLTAYSIWLDGTEYEARLTVGGSVTCVFYTQRGGTAVINGVLSASYGDDYDELGLINISAYPWNEINSAFSASGGIIAPGDAVYIGDEPFTDEVLRLSMDKLRFNGLP